MAERILLFDMDGVLLDPRGYHRALQKTVHLTGQALGYPKITLPQDIIHRFEASGITSEWDSSAVCLGLMLKAGWQAGLPLQVPRELAPQTRSRHGLPAPDWAEFLTRLNADGLPGSPLERGLSLLQQDLSRPQRKIIAGLVENAHSPAESLTHRIFQELVLGSSVYQATYDRQPALNTPGFLTKHDRPSLPKGQLQALKDWLAAEGHRAAILTNRPSQPPPPLFGTPEAELGAALVELDDLPLAGYGQMLWTAHQLQLSVEACRKPNPVHALSALQLAAGLDEQKALLSAGKLAHQGQVNESWEAFHQAEVVVFEDTPPGLESVRSARNLLQNSGIHLKLDLVGISRDPQKKEVLARRGAAIYPALGPALKDRLGRR